MLVALLGAELGACALYEPNESTDSDESESRVLVQYLDAYSNYEEPARWVISDADDWEQSWALLAGTERARPAVDFDREMVLVAGMGARNTGGYGIVVENVSVEPDGIYVDVLELSPGPRCAVTLALTAPVTMVTLPRTDSPVILIERSRTLQC